MVLLSSEVGRTGAEASPVVVAETVGDAVDDALDVEAVVLCVEEVVVVAWADEAVEELDRVTVVVAAPIAVPVGDMLETLISSEMQNMKGRVHACPS